MRTVLPLILAVSASSASAQSTFRKFDCVIGYQVQRQVHFSLMKGFIEDSSADRADARAIARSRRARTGKSPLLIACQPSGSKEAGYLTIEGRFSRDMRADGDSFGQALSTEDGQDIPLDCTFLDDRAKFSDGEAVRLRGFFQSRWTAQSQVRRVFIPFTRVN